MVAPLLAAEPNPLTDSGIKGGLIVHLGCGDAKLTAALRAGDSFVVQGLDADAGNVEAARKYIQSLDLYGKVSVELLSGKRLPYVDNLVTLVVSENPDTVPMDEIMRVLRPLGVACIKQGGQWVKTVKPWPANIDEWPQHYHGADNNAVAHDSVVAPPRHYQWTSTPEWSRAHLVLPSIQGLISARGRLFTIEDQASIEHPALPGEFTLVARDTFNGVVLWQHRFPDWHPMNMYVKLLSPQMMRRVVALDAGSGQRLWEKSGADTAGYQGSSLAVRGQYVAFYSAKAKTDAGFSMNRDHSDYNAQGAVVCLDRATGAVRWRKPVQLSLPYCVGAAPVLVLSDTTVYVADARVLHTFSLKDGTQLWTGTAKMNHFKPSDLSLTGGVVWTGNSHLRYLKSFEKSFEGNSRNLLSVMEKSYILK